LVTIATSRQQSDATEATHGSFRTPLTSVAIANGVQKLLLRFCYRKPSASMTTEAMNKSFWLTLPIGYGILMLLFVASVLFVGHVVTVIVNSKT
jgi:hypothetical protein